MKIRITKSFIVGILATGIMSIVLLITSILGLPKLSPLDLIAVLFGVSSATGWTIHLMTGIVFTFIYTFYFEPTVKVKNIYSKGILFGLSVFIISQIVLGILSMFIPLPESQGFSLLTMLNSVLGNLCFGLAVAIIMGNPRKLGGIGFRDNH